MLVSCAARGGERVSDELIALAADEKEDQALLKSYGSTFQRHVSTHFTVVSDCPAERVEQLIQSAEKTVERIFIFDRSLGIALTTPSHKMSIVYFNRWESFEQKARGAGMQANRQTPGFYDSRENRSYLFNYASLEMHSSNSKVDPLDRALALAVIESTVTMIVVRHEVAHQVLSNFGLQSPDDPRRWLTEGLAMQFEPEQGLNQLRLTDFLAACHKKDALLLKELVSDPDTLAPEATNSALRYATAWVLVKFLIAEKPERFARYLQEKTTKNALSASTLLSFEAAFGKVDEDFEVQLKKYAERLKR